MSGFFVLRTIQPLPMRRSFFASALTDGLIAGALDITAACIQQYLKNETVPMDVCCKWSR